MSNMHSEYPIADEYKNIRVINETRMLKYMEKIQMTDWTLHHVLIHMSWLSHSVNAMYSAHNSVSH